ncbi:MAG TPA: polymer-forming cytoskeletal protein [Bacteroidia bacterium]|nr:polymer-forming cytoskeletal protein [Bacteroidia bacterium]
MSKTSTTDSPSINLIGAGTIIEGDIKSNGDLRIDGQIKGSINVKGKLVVGSTGTIDGEVVCQNADISGTLRAKVTVSELLSLKSTAKLSGDLITNKLSIEPGADFTGSCSMGGVVKDLKHGGADATVAKEKAVAY